jgi:hypothetical protein
MPATAKGPAADLECGMSSRIAFYAACLAALTGGCALLGGGRGFKDDFSGYPDAECAPDGGRIGRWTVVSTGFGCVRAAGEGGRRWMHASTRRSALASETHAALLTGPKVSEPFTLSAKVMTVEQNRTDAAPNGWETAWLLWNYTDRDHFYYFIAKPDGWELGKRDPAFRGGQRFLIEGKEPVFPLRTWSRITITQSGGRIQVRSGGKLVTTFTDVQRPYVSGRIGLYGEDCFARFGDVSVALGEEQLEAGDREDDGQQALDRGVRQPGASEVGAREPARDSGRGEAPGDARERARLDDEPR